MAGARDSPKLNMEHGFIQTIIKNQVDRDEYDKEQKAISLQKKISGQSRPKKRAPLQMYVPPHLRAKAVDVKNKQESESSSKEDWEDDLRAPNTPASPEIRMTLEFERQDGEIRKLNICEGEDLRKVISSFGKANGLDSRLRDALLQRISNALEGRAS
ncbi:UPF0561 protein C2orf68 homolog [Porites lutea]|uniref:UPF0561 protein C2orf68 homolog n=1 Tax=Porites lutea TaxID=51062 RepID=UPI003CC6062D